MLTRLHARYGRGALADDLVFKVAGKITGGRENRRRGGELETGAQPANENAFQARYAIRHAWPGPVTCEKPQRGVWGEPWPDAGVGEHGAAAATKLAYAPRGNVTLASFVPRGVPELALLGAAAPPAAAQSQAGLDAAIAADGVAPPPRPSSRCGCDVVGGDRSDLSIAGSLIAIALAVGARRRSKPAN